MSEQIDPNGFGKDVERALKRVDDLDNPVIDGTEDI